MDELRAVVLAAGKGTRMKSDLAKVLHPLAGQPLLAHVLETLRELRIERTVVVVGHQADDVAAICQPYGAETVLQSEQLGTGHAVRQAESLLADGEGSLLVLCGDVPLLRPATLEALVERRRVSSSAAVVLSAVTEDASGYGRILRAYDGRVVGIVEERDATPVQRAIREYNTGSYCFDNQSLWPALDSLDTRNAQGEYYLTDVLSILVGQDRKVEAVICADEREVQGINTLDDLARARRDLEAMRRG